MKLRLSAIAIAFSLAFTTFSALAADSINVTQSGGGGTVDASQSGNAASGARAITIQQSGNGNEITVSQKNIQGFGNASVNQTNERNIAKIEQIDSTDVTAAITQSMNNNEASISQTSVRNATAEINQPLSGGHANIVQNNGSTNVNASIINTFNTSNIAQSNVNVGKAFINDQNAAASYASIRQYDGNNLVASITIPSGDIRQSLADITQTGSFQNASIGQAGDLSDVRALIKQDGTQNDAAILQSGLMVSGSAEIIQTGLGGLNVARISQSSSANTATITQNGSNFTANLNQGGSGVNRATISQHF